MRIAPWNGGCRVVGMSEQLTPRDERQPLTVAQLISFLQIQDPTWIVKVLGPDDEHGMATIYDRVGVQGGSGEVWLWPEAAP